MLKFLVWVVRIFVGVLFIFSGLIKAIDPIGLSYKMQEFFELWHLSSLNFLTLSLSVLMIAFEIIAGAALLLGWQMKLFSKLLLLLTLFFTFLTGYALLSGKFKNCGCFGDCFTIPPIASFLKDIVLTLLILFLLANLKKIRQIFSNTFSTITMLLIIAFSFGLQWYCLTYLPVIDCLPYKVGSNLTEKMQMPANAVPDSVEIKFVYQHNGKNIEFSGASFPDDFNDSTYSFVERKDKIIKKGKNNVPLISGFVLTDKDGNDNTPAVLSQPYALLIFCEHFNNSVKNWEQAFSELCAKATEKNMPVYMVTGQPDAAAKAIAATKFANIPIYGIDFTVIRAAARVTPTAYILKAGVVVDKQGGARFNKLLPTLASIGALAPPQAGVDTTAITDIIAQ